nr:trem-like transcript 4 protein isoform X5 [Meriones unguiculatus]
MAWRCSQLLLAPVLLVFLASGVWGAAVSEEVRRVVGQNLSVQCQYKPEAGPYVQKTWCQQTAPTRCNRVVTTSEPRKADKASQSTIWDDPEAGFFSITMTHLTEKDSAFYWCGPYNPSRNEMNVLRNISLVVSPASTPPQMTTWFPTSTASTPPQMTTWFPTSTETKVLLPLLAGPPRAFCSPFSVDSSCSRACCCQFSVWLFAEGAARDRNIGQRQ